MKRDSVALQVFADKNIYGQRYRVTKSGINRYHHSCEIKELKTKNNCLIRKWGGGHRKSNRLITEFHWKKEAEGVYENFRRICKFSPRHTTPSREPHNSCISKAACSSSLILKMTFLQFSLLIEVVSV